jgi:hypothetical protein
VATDIHEFFNLRDILKSHTEQDSSSAKEIEKVTDTAPGQVRHFTQHPIKAQSTLQ